MLDSVIRKLGITFPIHITITAKRGIYKVYKVKFTVYSLLTQGSYCCSPHILFTLICFLFSFKNMFVKFDFSSRYCIMCVLLST